MDRHLRQDGHLPCRLPCRQQLELLNQPTSKATLVYLRTKFLAQWRHPLATRSGTLVIRPTQAARQFIEAWRR